MKYISLKSENLKGKAVLLRADLNVPYKDGSVTDTTRIDRLKPTIDYLARAGAKTLILSHFGRPKGKADPEYSLAFLPPVLKERWGVDIGFAEDCIGAPAQKLAAALQEGEFGLLENLRFHDGEEANDPAFAQELAKAGDIFVNDAFSTAHRAHASTAGLADYLPAAAGLLMEEELSALQNALEVPKRPVMALVGGSKISTKLAVLANLVAKTDYLVLGGGMANTFLYAQGHDIGGSLCEKDMAEQARAIMAKAKNTGCEILLPADCVIVEKLAPGAPFSVSASETIPSGRMAVDIGPQSVEALYQKMKGVKTVLWNGPLGVFEISPFDNGTNVIARHVATLTKEGRLLSVAGGGDTVSALENAGAADDFSYISTAGGAFLEWLEGKTLPGVAALTEGKAQVAA